MTAARQDSPAHPVAVALAGVRAALSDAGGSPAWSMSDAEVVDGLGELFAVRAQVEAMVAAAVGEAEARGCTGR